LRRSATKMSETAPRQAHGLGHFHKLFQMFAIQSENGRRLAFSFAWMLAVAANSVALSGCLILERKDFNDRSTPLAIRTDENAQYPIGRIIQFNLDTDTNLVFDTQIIDETPQRLLIARWALDDALVNDGEVPANNTGGRVREYSDTIDRAAFSSVPTGRCHTLTLYVSHQFYSDVGEGQFLPIVPDSGDIAIATWYVVTVDSTNSTGSCSP